jgi:hypothetical protein
MHMTAVLMMLYSKCVVLVASNRPDHGYPPYCLVSSGGMLVVSGFLAVVLLV